jgi:two-component system OmpR family response regulator
MHNSQLKKIMVVEDEEDIRVIVKYTLEKLGGFEVKCCESGELFLAEVNGYSPDLVLMDMMMPGMDGIMTLNAYKALNHENRAPVVFMTAKVQPHEIVFYKETGAIDVIPKPFNAKELPARLANIYNSIKERIV